MTLITLPSKKAIILILSGRGRKGAQFHPEAREHRGEEEFFFEMARIKGMVEFVHCLRLLMEEEYRTSLL